MTTPRKRKAAATADTDQPSAPPQEPTKEPAGDEPVPVNHGNGIFSIDY